MNSFHISPQNHQHKSFLIMFMRTLCVILHLGLSALKASEHPYENLTVVVSSCDKYADLWPGFFQLLFRTWPTLQTQHKTVPIILIANTKTFEHPRVLMSHFPHEKSWSDNMIETLQKVKTSHVLFLLDDYFLTHFNEKRFQEILAFCIKNPHVAYIQLHLGQPHVGGPVSQISGVFHKLKTAPFVTALQASLWRTKDFLHLLRAGENPWAFENEGTKRAGLLNKDFLLTLEDQPLSYLNMMHMGYLDSSQMVAAQKLGIHIHSQQLKLDKDYPLQVWWKYRLKERILDFWNYIKSWLSL